MIINVQVCVLSCNLLKENELHMLLGLLTQ
jgi:hypothetical protein